jgi:hypothetical protein
MANIMTASMTDGQIDNLVNKFRAAVCKHSSKFGSDAVQQVLGVENLGMELFEPFRKRVEAISSIIVRFVKADRLRAPQEVLDATGRKQYVNAKVVSAMPRGEIDEGEVRFFKPRPEAYNKNGWISDDDLEKEFGFYGLKPCDPYKLSKVNADDPAFADEHLNATHWKDADGKWCFVFFSRWDGERIVSVRRSTRGWRGNWWFAGLRK